MTTVEQAAALHAATEQTLVAALKAHAISTVEVPLAARMAAKVNTGHSLSTEEVRSAFRLIERNREAIQDAGIALPAPAVPATPPPPPPKRRYRVELAIRNNTRSQGVAAYNQHIVVDRPPMEVNEALKKVAHAEWDKVNRWWHTPATPAYAHNLMLALADFDPMPSPRVASLAQEFETMVARRAVLHPDHPEPEFPTGHLVNAQLWGHQMRAVPYCAGSTASLLAVPMGGGKALDLSTPIATPTGWTTMGELTDGDRVFDERGDPCTVVTAHSVLRGRRCYEVTFSDGSTIVADADHLWFTQTRNDRTLQGYDRSRGNTVRATGGVRTTEEIRCSLRVEKRKLVNHSIPLAGPLTLPDAELPISSYVLGVWLGDGCTSSGRITTADGDQLRELLALEGYECGPDTSSEDRCETFTIYGLVTELRGLGVLGNKHIPDSYLRASEKQRRALLAGLLDTDGTVGKGGKTQFDSMTERLAYGVLELVTSLGYRPTMTSKMATLNGREMGTSWRVSFTTNDPVFWLDRRLGALAQRTVNYAAERNRHRYIVDVRPVYSRPVRCITVNSPSRLYLAGRSMIPTHNTAAAIAVANEVDASRVIIVCPNKVRGVWPREIAKWSARAWHIVDGTRPAQRRGARRQDLSVAERLEQAESCLFDCPCGVAVHAAVFNYEMLTHQLISGWRAPLPIDLAIYDEVHRAKSASGTGGSANLARWVDFTKRRIGLSGTPMPQNPWDIFGVYRVLDPGIFGPVWTTFQATWVEMTKRKEPLPGKNRAQEYPKRIKPSKQAEFAAKVHSIMYRPTVDLKLPPVTHMVRTVEFEPDARKEYDRLSKDFWADLSAFVAVQAPAKNGVVHWDELGDDVQDAIALGRDAIDLDAVLRELSAQELDAIGGDADVLTPKNVLAKMLRLMQYTGGTVPNDEGAKRRVSRAKSDELMEFRGDTPIGGILFDVGCYPDHPGGVEPVCVYAHFRDDLDAIREVATRAGLRYAEISGRRGDGLTDTSEMTPDADVVGVQIQSGGTGVDLTRACVGIWYSKGHSVGNYDQALARQHRPGQTRPVTFVHLEVDRTIDHDVYRSLMSHRAVVAGVLSLHGFNRPELGGDDRDEVPAEFDTVLVGESERGGEGVRLPIDDFGVDVLGDPRPSREPMFTPAQREQLWLDDVL